MISISISILISLLLLFLAQTSHSFTQFTPAERRVIAQCLDRFGGLTKENAARLQRYKDWSENYEEIPCFTKCYLTKMLDIYNETHGFQHENVVRQFSQPLYDICSDNIEAAGFINSCESVYKGFHCLVRLENDPFAVIETIREIDAESKTAMKNCLRKFDQTVWVFVRDYENFPEREPIPCFTRCVVEQLQLYNQRTRRWNFQGLRSKLGINAHPTKPTSCRSVYHRRVEHKCTWMYQEINCLKKGQQKRTTFNQNNKMLVEIDNEKIN